MVDYSKWKDIEISDDEDDTHPNIDTPSLFRWRHQARVERMEEQKKEKAELERKKIETAKKLAETKAKLEIVEKEKKETKNVGDLKKALQELELEEEKVKEKEIELNKKETLAPWNVDTIAQPGFAKTVINTKPKRADDDADLDDDAKEERMREYVKKNEKKLKQFGMLRRYDDSKAFLLENPDLVGENTANYLVIWCINLEMEGKTELMNHVAHQCICMQYILELSKQLDIDPRACVGSFFSRIQIAEVEYKKSFDDELIAFRERITKRAAEKLEIARKEAEEEERQARLGPGGLDPIEVFESLPEPLQKCFETQDIPLLQKTVAEMPPDEAKYHMRRCVDSGLWLADANDKKNQEAGLVPSDTKPDADVDADAN